MKLYRIRAIIERDMRKFFRSPALMMTSMVFPLMQLIVLGYAFGGKIKNVRLALVDEDRSAESRVLRGRLNAIAQGPQTFRTSEYRNLPEAMTDLRAGFVKAVLDAAPDFSEPVLGLVSSGAIKGLMAGFTITIIGGLIAGIERLWDPVRLVYLVIVLGVTALAMISFMFLLMVRVSDPLVPRAIFGVLNTLLYFPSGAIYPTEGFPVWLRWISVIDPFTYAVHALKNLLLKNTGFEGIYGDVGILSAFAIVLISGCIALFKRQI